MTIEDFKLPKKEVKIIASTRSKNYKANAMIGTIGEVMIIDYVNKNMGVYTPDKSDYWYFEFSDVQEMTPLSHNGVRIGIGDTVNDEIVYSYYWLGGQFILLTCFNDDFPIDCYTHVIRKILSHTPLYPKVTDEVAHAIEVLTKAGKLKDGKVIV